MSQIYQNYIQTYIYSKYVEARRGGRGKLFAIQFKGWAEIEKSIAGLSTIDQSKAIRSGLRSGATYLKRKGKQRLKQRVKGYDTDTLYNSFVARIKRRSLGALVGFNKKGHHSHLVDRGTIKRKHPKTGTSGIMPANRFWTDTAEQDWKETMERVQQGIDRAVFRIMMRQT